LRFGFPFFSGDVQPPYFSFFVRPGLAGFATWSALHARPVFCLHKGFVFLPSGPQQPNNCASPCHIFSCALLTGSPAFLCAPPLQQCWDASQRHVTLLVTIPYFSFWTVSLFIFLVGALPLSPTTPHVFFPSGSLGQGSLTLPHRKECRATLPERPAERILVGHFFPAEFGFVRIFKVFIERRPKKPGPRTTQFWASVICAPPPGLGLFPGECFPLRSLLVCSGSAKIRLTTLPPQRPIVFQVFF